MPTQSKRSPLDVSLPAENLCRKHSMDFMSRLQPSEEHLRNAAKARIRRMVTEKKKRTDLAVPQWVKDEWEKGTRSRDQMAEVLQEVNWQKGPLSCERSVYPARSC